MTDWLLHQLADRLGVAPARPGEATAPHIRLEQPWEQWQFLLILLGSAGLIIWLYWHEGKASRASKLLLAGLRMSLVLLAMFMLSEAVLSVERTGLPYLTILVDDSASERIADQYEKPEVKAALEAIATQAQPDRNHQARDRQGLDPQGPCPAAPGTGKEAQGSALSGLELGSSAGRGRQPVRYQGRRAEVTRGRSHGHADPAGRRRSPGAHRIARSTSDGHRASFATGRPPKASRCRRHQSSPRAKECRSL